MISKTVSPLIIFVSILVLFPGCSFNRTRDPRSASEVFFDVAEGVIDMFSEDLTRDQIELKKRRNWQRENLSTAELNELGITR